MKREPELIRKILLEIQKQPVGKSISLLNIDGYQQDVIGEHVRLLVEGSFVDAKLFERKNMMSETIVDEYSISRLLNEGHDFLEIAQNDTVWEKAKKIIQDKGGDVSLSVFKGVLTKVASQYFLDF